MNQNEEMADPVGEQLQEILELLAAGDPHALDAADAELAAEARLALTLASVLPTRPDPVFRAGLQARLQAESSEFLGVAGPWERRRPRWQALLPRLAAGVLACVLVVSSAVVASADALPGDALYSVKRAAEEARILLVLDPAERARQRLLLAQERLDELLRLAGSGAAIDQASLAPLLDARARAMAEADGTPGAEAAVLAWSVDAAHALLGLRVVDPGGAAFVRDAADLLAPGVPEERAPATPTARVAQATPEAPTSTATTAGASATTRPTSSLRAPTATVVPPFTTTPRPTATAQSGLPVASAAPPSPIPMQPTVVPGETDPAINPGATERAIILTKEPRHTQAAPATPNSPPSQEPPSEPRP